MRRFPRYLLTLLILALVAAGLATCQEESAESTAPATASDTPPPGVVEGMDTLTGLIARGDYLLVKGNCLACHSAKLITQNRASKEGWLDMIHWMQETQGLQDLGKNEGPIVEYLATYYAPEESGRRPALDSVKWYMLDL